MMTTGERIKERRIELGLSADRLAEKIGISRSTMFRYESGAIEKVPMENLVPIAHALNTTVKYLMGWETSKLAENPWSTRFQDSLQTIYNNIDTIDAEAACIDLSKWEEAIYSSSPLTLDECCDICEEAGESLSDMVGLHEGDSTEDEVFLTTEAKKIAVAFDKATAKEKQMVRLALSEYLDTEEEIKPIRIAALSNDGSAIDFSAANPDAELPNGFSSGPAIP